MIAGDLNVSIGNLTPKQPYHLDVRILEIATTLAGLMLVGFKSNQINNESASVPFLNFLNFMELSILILQAVA